MRETRHFAKIAAERPGSSGGRRRSGVRCEHCARRVKRRRRCAFCYELLCPVCLPSGADECRDCVTVKQALPPLPSPENRP